MATYTDEEKAELESLRKKADLMGISYSGNTSLEKLREKVAKVQGTIEEEEEKQTVYNSLYDEKMKLVRCQVQCLDPQYKNSGGVFISLSNAVLGSHKWFIYFNQPIMITQWAYDYLKNCKYVDRSERGRRGNDGLTHSKTVNTDMKSYAITDLPMLTEEELKKLAEEQTATGRLENKD
jgi:hypothetical protein